MDEFRQLVIDLDRIAETVNRFEHPDVQAAAFNLLGAAIATPPKPDRYAVTRDGAHRADHTPTAVIPTVV